MEMKQKQSVTSAECKDSYSLIISFNEAKWLCNHFWRTFFLAIQQVADITKDNFNAVVEKLKSQDLLAHQWLLEQSLVFG